MANVSHNVVKHEGSIRFLMIVWLVQATTIVKTAVDTHAHKVRKRTWGGACAP